MFDYIATPDPILILDFEVYYYFPPNPPSNDLFNQDLQGWASPPPKLKETLISTR